MANTFHLFVPEKPRDTTFIPSVHKRVQRWRISWIIIRCKLFFLFIGRKPTTWPTNISLLIHNVVQLCRLQIILCSCVDETMLSSFLRSLLRENGTSLRFPNIFILKNKLQWSNDKTVIELGYRKISWFVSVSQINYLPQPSASANNWSARHWQSTIFCSTMSNNC